MNEKISHLLEQINALEEEVQSVMNEQRNRLLYEINGKRVEFERSIIDTHRRLKVGLFHWFLTARPLNYLTAPIIYSMIVPLALIDLCISFYQLSCFPIYGISKVKRSDYFAFDHQHLAYLNIIEKLDCIYCSYASGLMAYAGEIVARTEQYFCPIKHAQKVKGTHARYQYFLDYGDAKDLHKMLEEIRVSLINEQEKLPK
jgi:hypothetical protein